MALSWPLPLLTFYWSDSSPQTKHRKQLILGHSSPGGGPLADESVSHLQGGWMAEEIGSFLMHEHIHKGSLSGGVTSWTNPASTLFCPSPAVEEV